MSSRGLTKSQIQGDSNEPVLESTVSSTVRYAAEKYPGQIGLVYGEPAGSEYRRWSFREMLTEVDSVAKALLTHFKPGERIAVWGPNSPEWVFLQLGGGMAGLVLVPLNPAFRKPELEYALKQSEAVGLFYVSEYRDNPLHTWVDETRRSLP